MNNHIIQYIRYFTNSVYSKLMVKKYEQAFKEQTWLDLYEASLRYWMSVWLSITCRDEAEELLLLLPDWFKEWFEALILATSEQTKSESTVLKTAIEYSIGRCFTKCRTDSLTHMSNYIFDHEELISILLSMWAKGINPIILINSWEVTKRFRSVLNFTASFARDNPFVIPIYKGKSHNIAYYEIDNDLLSKQEIVLISRADITGLDIKLFHPIVRGRIRVQDFTSLLI